MEVGRWLLGREDALTMFRLSRVRVSALLVAAILLPLVVVGQSRRNFSSGAATVPYDSNFAFTRIRYSGGGFGFGGSTWSHDYPAADRNLSAIVDYITNMRLSLDGTNVLDLSDPRVFENPIIYVSEPGFWRIRDDEAPHLRNYLLKGGFVIFDDFDGDDQWANMAAQMARALPDHRFIDIGPEHPIFHTFFEVKGLDVPHPMINVVPIYRAMFENNDPSRRMIALANHNNDIAEYWEWSAEGLYNPDPTNNAYRLGVNYIVYGMTH
jgi:Domain of unknown function (DUF4159)